MPEHHNKLWRLAPGAFSILAMLTAASCSSYHDKSVIEASGTIEVRTTDISSKTAGDVLSIFVEEGSEVSQHDTLMIIDQSTLDVRLRQADAAADLAKAQLDLLLKGARSEDIQRAEDAVTQAETGMSIATRDAERMRELHDKGTATDKQLEDAEARLKVTEAQYNSSVQALKTIRNVARPEEIRAAEAGFRQAQAARDLIAISISDCYIVSPVPGTVTDLHVESGELVGPGSILATVSTLDTAELMIYITEIELGKTMLGQEASVRVDSYSDREFRGSVAYISPEAEFTPKNIQTKEERVKLVYGVKIVVPNPDHALKAGMPADARVYIQNDSDQEGPSE
jgi:HlyD family secretion protein